MVLLDACVRLLPGVMGKAASGAEESFEAGLLEYPHYTRPREWEGRAIPEVLLSGDHARSPRWRRAEAERITQERRPDLGRRGGDHHEVLKRAPRGRPGRQAPPLLYGAPQLTTGCRKPRAAVSRTRSRARQEH